MEQDSLLLTDLDSRNLENACAYRSPLKKNKVLQAIVLYNSFNFYDNNKSSDDTNMNNDLLNSCGVVNVSIEIIAQR